MGMLNLITSAQILAHVRGPFHFYLDFVYNMVMSEPISKLLVPNYSPSSPL